MTSIKSVLVNLPNYYMSLFATPTGVLNKLEGIRQRFLWGGSEGRKKIHWVFWNKIIVDKAKGGLGVGSIKSLNISLLVKWWWRLRSEPFSLWAKVITSIHKCHDKDDDCYSLKTLTEVWNNITCIKHDLDKAGIPHEKSLKKYQEANEV